MKKNTVSFWTDGESFTNLIRDLWVSLLPRNALMALDAGEQVTMETALNICQGKLKFEGDTREGDHTLKIVEDSSTHYHNCPLLSLEEIVKKIEKQFIEKELFLRLNKKDFEYYCNASIGPKESETNKLINRIENIRNTVKYVLKQLDYVYPIIGKDMSDLPLDKVITIWCECEERRFRDLEITKRTMKDRGKGILASFDLSPDLIDERFDKISDKLNLVNKIGIDPESLNVEKYVSKMIEESKRDEIKSEPISTSKFNSGYVCPKGRFYGCADTNHASFSGKLIEQFGIDNNESDAQKWFDNNYWVKVSCGRLFFLEHDEDGNKSYLTKDQIDTVIDFCNRRKTEGKNHIHFNGSNYPFDKIYDRLIKKDYNN